MIVYAGVTGLSRLSAIVLISGAIAFYTAVDLVCFFWVSSVY